MRLVLLFVFLAIAAFVANSCTSFEPYRAEFDRCDGVISLKPGYREKDFPDPERLKCAVQTYAMAAPYIHPLAYLGTPAEPDQFRLTFLELGNGVPVSVRHKQLDKISNILRFSPQDYVIVFIHGWRHNAKIGDLDVARFRVLLAYARSFLNSRCTEKGRYCDARLTGVYVGWRGAAVEEPEGDSIVGTAMAVPTFWSRKAESERIGGDALASLRTLAGVLRLAPGDYSADKMLVLGHSFGGNMLAHALSKEIASKILEHSMGHEMAPPLGDLVALVNPASEARNWTRIQEGLAKKVGRSVVVGRETPNDQFESIFPITQRPTYLAFTSTCDWAAEEINAELDKEERKKGLRPRAVECDWATGRIFPLGQFAALRWPQDRRRTIGHTDPVYDPAFDTTKTPPAIERFVLRPETLRLGTSHEFIVNNGLFDKGKAIPTNFENAARSDYSQCDVADGWLLAARNREAKNGGRGWDSAYTSNGKSKLLWVNADKNKAVEAQFRHSLSLPGSLPGQIPSIAPANSPFWNIRAFDSAIALHGRYVGYPFWCSLNQLVLDNPVARASN
jgi:hypothetical protein